MVESISKHRYGVYVIIFITSKFRDVLQLSKHNLVIKKGSCCLSQIL